MNKSFFVFTITIIIVFCLSVEIFSEDRQKPLDIIIALDKSLSMEEEIDEVKKYLIEKVLSRIIVDDYFLLIVFYRRAEVVVGKYIHNGTEKVDIENKILSITADGRFTDIGNVLDRLKDELNERLNNNRDKYFLLITDSIHEPPKDSKYYSTTGDFTHEYLEYLDEIGENPSWKIQVVHIGGSGKGEELEKELKSDYITTTENFTSEELAEKIIDIGSMKIIEDSINTLSINNKGVGQLNFAIESQRYLTNTRVIVESVVIDSINFSNKNTLNQPFEITFPPQGKTELVIPLQIDEEKIKEGDYSANLVFSFSSKEHFEENIKINIHVKGFFENYPILLPVLICIGILIVVAILIIIIMITKGKALQFRLDVREAPLATGKDNFKINKNKELFIKEIMDKVTIVNKRDPKCIARLRTRGTDLLLFTIKQSKFPESEGAKIDVFNKTILIITESGLKYHLTFIIES